MIFAIILIASLWLFQSILLESFYKQIKTQSLKDTANVIATSLEKLDSTSLKSLHQTINNLAVENEISVTVIDSTSSTSTESFSPVFSVIATQDNVLDMLSGFQLFQIYKSAAENEGEFLQHYQRGAYTMSVISDKENENSENDFAEWNDDEFPKVESKQSVKHGIPPFFKFGITQELLFAKIVNSNNGHEYLLLFDSIITPVHTTVRTLKIQLIIQSIIILIIAALSAKKLSKKISRPITDINQSAKKLAAGNYDTEFHGDGYLEVSQLADTLNFTARELKQSDSLKRELIANTSHDLRTPLTMIIGYAEVMRDLPGENTPENIQVIIDEASRLTNLVNDMLDLSKLQSGKTKLELSEFNLTKLVEDIVERMRKLTEKDGFDFKFSCDRNVFVKADETKITQVIYNFLTNAVNYSGESREILIEQKVNAGKVRLEFTDHGSGIPKEKLPSIWDRYYKIDNTHKRSQVGSGIGLSIVKSILELHKAKYGVISDSASGSTFWFELPVSDIIK
jgi:signal transduction histidine kinase